MSIPLSLRRLVIQRSKDCCEYCGISQLGQVATFHIDHVIPVVAGGETTSENLALACVSCSLRKGARQDLKDANLDAIFFSHMYRHSLVQRQVTGLAVGSTMPSLNNEIMGKLVFPYVKKTEQEAIADRVGLTEARITTLDAELVKLLKQKSGLMHDLLTGKVQVNIDSTEAVND
jgi:HNH endonuclease